MAFLLTDGDVYIGTDTNNSATVVNIIDKALCFSSEDKALNYKGNLKSILKKYNWHVEEIDEKKIAPPEHSFFEDGYGYNETELEQSGFDIYKFFNDTISTVSQLQDYADNMKYLEKEYDKKILDVRHYKRDPKTKLNAIQLQRLEQFEIQLERERYECKANRMMAEIFLTDMTRIGNKNYLKVIKNIRESDYQPKVLTYELIDGIVGKITRKEAV